MSEGPRVELASVSRRFGAALAVKSASVVFEPGRLHAVVGENGAGKSTLLKMAAGAVTPSEGAVKIGGVPLAPHTTAEAIRRGVGLVYQHFMLSLSFTALENLMLGSEPMQSFGRLDRAAAKARAESLQRDVGLDVRLDRVTDELTVGERQRLEILRVLFRGARAILLDEPTAVLSPLEADELYATLKKLAEGGATIAVVTHRLDEVERHADRVTVMRRGEVVMERDGRASASEIANAVMGGRSISATTPPLLSTDAAPCLVIRGLSLDDGAGVRLLDGLELEAHAGEIVGVAGVEGNGQRELVRALAGLEPRATGHIEVGGEELGGLSIAARRARLGVVHEDRHVEGLVLDATVADNLVLGELDRGIDERATVERRLERFGVEPRDPSHLARDLSGGNQQKLVLARPFDRLVDTVSAAPSTAKAALVLAQPTRGVDIGAAGAIHSAIAAAATSGLAVLVVSADLAELKHLAHRIVVLRRGRVVATFAPDADDALIGRAMLGVEAA